MLLLFQCSYQCFKNQTRLTSSTRSAANCRLVGSDSPSKTSGQSSHFEPTEPGSSPNQWTIKSFIVYIGFFNFSFLTSHLFLSLHGFFQASFKITLVFSPSPPCSDQHHFCFLVVQRRRRLMTRSLEWFLNKMEKELGKKWI